MDILVSGSLAFDRIMDFPGKFSDHILADKIHILNVCFMINGLKENFGGTAGNIAYVLALLGEKPKIIACAGRDFAPYQAWLEKYGIPTEHITVTQEELTAGAYITTDKSDNQITAFNPGAMKYPAPYNFDTLKAGSALAIIAPGNLEDMISFSRVYRDKGIDYIFDPGQSLPAWDGEQLVSMITGSMIFISNDYELELTMEKTGATLEKLTTMAGMVITTKAEQGSVISFNSEGKVRKIEVPAAGALSVKDPTGAGDAYRAGLIKGLLLNGKDIELAARMGAVAASFSVEVYGTQNFFFTKEEFNERFEKTFGKKA